MTDAAQRQVPGSIRAAQLLVALQALALGATAVGLLVELVVSAAHRVWIALSLTAFVIGLAVVLLLCAKGLGQARLTARTPIVLTELLCLPVGWGLIQAGRYPIGVPLIAVALAVLAAMFSKGSRDWLSD